VRAGSAYSYEFADRHGTGSLTLDATFSTPIWRQLTPYGGPRGTAPASWPDNRAFLDKPADTSTGLTAVGARWYDPDTGRFVSIDPVLEFADSQQLNGYTYAAQNPIASSDPTGLIHGPPGAQCDQPSCWPTASNPGEAYQVNGGCVTCSPSHWRSKGESWQTPSVLSRATLDALRNYLRHLQALRAQRRKYPNLCQQNPIVCLPQNPRYNMVRPGQPVQPNTQPFGQVCATADLAITCAEGEGGGDGGDGGDGGADVPTTSGGSVRITNDNDSLLKMLLKFLNSGRTAEERDFAKRLIAS
jgi:RHS repeat-associated protein